ncbi:hypothetical protein QQF64_020563, partial [Cirrhinus molitorella]
MQDYKRNNVNDLLPIPLCLPRRYATERVKITYIITLLTGKAREWGTAVWEAESAFCSQLTQLRQGTLAASCGWDDGKHHPASRSSWRLEETHPSKTPASPSPLADVEPMQLGQLRLLAREKQQRLVQGLCLYCGQAGHFALSCPFSAVISYQGSSHTCKALIDSGAEASFLDFATAQSWGIPAISLSTPVTVWGLSGRSIATVTHTTPHVEAADLTSVPEGYHDLRLVFNPESQFIVEVDASDVGFGGSGDGGFDDPILPGDVVVGALSWGIERRVQEAGRGIEVPEGCPASCLFVPEALRPEVLQWGHESKVACHPGIRRSLASIRQRFWWPSMGQDGRAAVSSRLVCRTLRCTSPPSTAIVDYFCEAPAQWIFSCRAGDKRVLMDDDDVLSLTSLDLAASALLGFAQEKQELDEKEEVYGRHVRNTQRVQNCYSMADKRSLFGEQNIPAVKSFIHGESPEPSCVSMKSAESKGTPVNFKNSSADVRISSVFSNKQDGTNLFEMKKLDSIFKELKPKMISLIKKELKNFKRLLSPDYPGCSEREQDDDDKEDCLLRLLPVVKTCRKADLSGCGLTEKSCLALALALSSNSTNLRELNLSDNNLEDSGQKHLSTGLKNPQCKLEILKLSRCLIREEGCAALASAMRLNPSHLRELDLNWNKPGDTGVKFLSDVLKDPQCKLEKVLLWDCNIGEEGCTALASALRSNPSHLRELNLNYNKPGFSGIKQLAALLKDHHCKLIKLMLDDCNIGEEDCAALISAIRSNPSHLRELNLNYNEPGESGVKLLSTLLKDPQCNLEELKLSNCSIKEKGCAALASALRSNPSHLRKLDLSCNKLGESGVRQLSALLKGPQCKLETLKVWECKFGEQGCAVLASALRSNKSHLRELNLSYNKLGDSAMKLLSDLLQDPHCKLEKLLLSECSIGEEGCNVLVSSLRLNPSHLRFLNMNNNEPGHSGVKQISDLLQNPLCKLEKLWLSNCGITEEDCIALASALKSNPSHLIQLNLSKNKPGDSGVKLLDALQNDPHCKL